ncbi:Oxysterol-binding protein OBPa, partial [Coemansia sp. RSA 2603]
MSKCDDVSVVEEELDEEPRSIILSMISQLSKDMDLSRITFPTFVLEPRSFTERVTDFMSHPDFLI